MNLVSLLSFPHQDKSACLVIWPSFSWKRQPPKNLPKWSLTEVTFGPPAIRHVASSAVNYQPLTWVKVTFRIFFLSQKNKCTHASRSHRLLIFLEFLFPNCAMCVMAATVPVCHGARVFFRNCLPGTLTSRWSKSKIHSELRNKQVTKMSEWTFKY